MSSWITPSKSSNVLKLAYDPDTGTLRVVYVSDPSTAYAYSHVPRDIASKLLSAKSAGGAVSQLIRPGFAFKKELV